jgi:hypothetical protein
MAQSCPRIESKEVNMISRPEKKKKKPQPPTHPEKRKKRVTNCKGGCPCRRNPAEPVLD